MGKLRDAFRQGYNGNQPSPVSTTSSSLPTPQHLTVSVSARTSERPKRHEARINAAVAKYQAKGWRVVSIDRYQGNPLFNPRAISTINLVKN